VRQLEPRLQFGFTATVPRADAATVLYSYDLPECLRDGIYTKSVKMWVEPAPTDISEDDWDKVTLDFALQRLETKRLAMKDYCERHPENPFLEPVLLVAARDTEHADSVGACCGSDGGWLRMKSRSRTPTERHPKLSWSSWLPSIGPATESGSS